MATGPPIVHDRDAVMDISTWPLSKWIEFLIFTRQIFEPVGKMLLQLPEDVQRSILSNTGLLPPESAAPPLTQEEPYSMAIGEKTKSAKDVTISRAPVLQITVPEKMPLREAADWLIRKDQQEDKKVAVYHEIDAFPLDGAVAFRDALAEIYGFVEGADIPGGFFEPDQPPIMVGVPTGQDTMRQVPWGRIVIPGVAGFLETSLRVNPMPKFVINGETKQRHLPEIEAIVKATKDRLATHSVYRGKAIRLDLSWLREPNPAKIFSPTGHAPRFTIPIDKIREDELVFSGPVQSDVDLGLFTPIEHSGLCREHKIPLKRGILLSGEYGVGKTLLSSVTAKKAVTNGWTFIYLTNALDMAQGFRFAAMYAPAVLFVEDGDRVVGGDDRTEDIDAVLNAFDGVDTKNVEIITVITTNHLEKMNQAILRPGRCDTLIQITRPDAAAAIRLVLLYGRGLFDPTTDFPKIGDALANHLPAEIREAVERAKLAAVRRVRGPIEGKVREQDVLSAVHAMSHQHDLLQPKSTDPRGILERVGDAFGERVGDAVADGFDKATATLLNGLQQIGYKANDMRGAADRMDDDEDVMVLAGTNGHG
jgi:transitional endoplasmic reticulum ATPase